MTSSFRIGQHLLGARLELATVGFCLLGAPRVTFNCQNTLVLACPSRSACRHLQLPQRAQRRIRCSRLNRPWQLSPEPQAEGRRSRCSDCVVVSAAASPGTPYQNTSQLRQLGLVLGITDYKDLQRLIRYQSISFASSIAQRSIRAAQQKIKHTHDKHLRSQSCA